jgi:hypothetical protein
MAGSKRGYTCWMVCTYIHPNHEPISLVVLHTQLASSVSFLFSPQSRKPDPDYPCAIYRPGSSSVPPSCQFLDFNIRRIENLQDPRGTFFFSAISSCFFPESDCMYLSTLIYKNTQDSSLPSSWRSSGSPRPLPTRNRAGVPPPRRRFPSAKSRRARGRTTTSQRSSVSLFFLCRNLTHNKTNVLLHPINLTLT